MSSRRGKLPKPDGERQGRAKRKSGLVIAFSQRTVDVPAAPSGLLVATRREWDSYWASHVSNATIDADMPAVERLFMLRDEWRRCFRVYREHRLVEGSKGQARINPLADQAHRLEQAISKLEAELGLTPLARARLGLTMGEAQLTLDQLNDAAVQLEADDPHDPRVVEASDPQ